MILFVCHFVNSLFLIMITKLLNHFKKLLSQDMYLIGDQNN